MDKIPAEYLAYLWPMRHYLVTCGRGARANVAAVSFCMPVSREPPLVACAIGRQALSCELIRECREFVVNVPEQGLKRQVYACGYRSGREVDKFKAAGLTPQPARVVVAPIVAECVAHLECRVENEVDAGDKTLFIARVVEAYADEDVACGRRAAEYAAGPFPANVYGTRFPQGGAGPARP